MTDLDEEIARAKWMRTVVDVLADHPGWAASTVQAMQAGIMEALDREWARRETVSWGLMEALNTKPGQLKRDHERIIAGIEASNFCDTPWSKKMIAREQA